MEDLRYTFLIFGIVTIVAILVHGLWTIRKNGKGKEKPKFESRNWQNKSDPSIDNDEGYDDHGVGSVRVVSSTPTKADVVEPEPEDDEHEPLPNRFLAESSSSDEDHYEINDAEASIDPIDTKPNEENKTKNNSTEHDLSVDDDLSIEHTEMDFAELAQEHQKESPAQLYGSVVTQPKPGFQRASRPADTAHRQPQKQDNGHMPEPPPFLLKSAAAHPDVNPDISPDINISPDTTQKIELAEDEKHVDTKGRIEPEFKLDAEQAPVEAAKPISLAAQARRLVSRRKKSVADVIRKEPDAHGVRKLNEEQMRIDFSNDENIEQAPASNPQSNVRDKPAANQAPTTTQQPTASAQSSDNAGKAQEQASDVLVLNVRAPEDREITGAALLPMLLTLGLKFGEQDIFHRHVNTNGKGPVLFSLANLFKPGVFDIDNIETFSTRGLSLFMMLPIEGDAQQVFNMMHNAARKLADEFGCQILDGSRGVLTKQGLQKYSERIRDFERKRINR